MKTPGTIILLMCLLSMAACKKESFSNQFIKDAAAQNSAASSEAYCPKIDPSDFVKGISNPYLAFTTRTKFYYVNKIVEDNKLTIEHNPVIVTSDTKLILGVPCTVVHDVVKVNGKITEDTYD